VAVAVGFLELTSSPSLATSEIVVSGSVVNGRHGISYRFKYPTKAVGMTSSTLVAATSSRVGICPFV